MMEITPNTIAHDDLIMASHKAGINEKKNTGAERTRTVSAIESSFIDTTTGRKGLEDTIRAINDFKRAEELLHIQHDFVKALGGADSLDEVLRHCVRFAIKGSGMDCAGIYLLKEDGALSLLSHSGLPQAFIGTAAWYAPNSPCAKLVSKGDPIFTHYDMLDVPADRVCKQEGLEAFGIIPIKHEQAVIGFLNVGSRKLNAVSKMSQSVLITMTSLMGQYVIRKQAEENLRKSEARLAERVKELNCLFKLSNLIETPGISMEEVLGQGVRLITTGWQYPDITCARLVIDGREYQTGNYQDTEWRLSRDVVVCGHTLGKLDVCYLERRPEADEGPFLKEERSLIEAVTERLRRVIERGRIEDALRKSEKKYRNLYENAQIGLFRTRFPDGLFLEANQRIVEMFGYDSQDDLIERHSIAEYYIEPEARPRVIAELKRNGEIRNYETRFRKKDGSIWWARFSGTLYKKEGYFEGIATEITENKQAEAEKARLEEQYRQSQKVEAIGRLAGGVAHDMNNLLTPIIGFGEMLMTDFNLSPDDKRRRSVNQIVQAGYRARDLVRQLLAFGRKQTLEYKPVNINKTVEGFERLLRRTIREDIAIEIIPAPDIPAVKGDVGQIEQVIMNLAVNGQDAMSDGGRLTLETAMIEINDDHATGYSDIQAGRYVILAVSDTGCGMDEEALEHIFEPFFSTKGKEGTGLGLATVHGIVKQHNGDIRVYSVPGKGTTFTVYLPISDEALIEKSTRDEPVGDLSGSETILLVEDNVQVCDLGYAVLKQHGYTVLLAENGAEALTLLASHDGPVHLLLTDVVMPGMNGKELFIRAADQYPDLKVLYMSGYTDNVIAHHGVLSEGVQFIQKPFSGHELSKRLREALAQD